MRHPTLLLLFSLPVLAQSNAVPGLDVQIHEIGDATAYGRRGAAYPNGEIGINLGHSMCNRGTVNLPWTGGTTGVMLETYPKIASLLVCERDGRMFQVSGKSYCKHSRVAFNFTSGPCVPCQSGPSATWRVGCSDTYGSGFSGSGSLGPTEEIDPWLGTWNPFGSYFDRGDPAVTGPAATDGIRSPISWGTDIIKNRMILQEQEVVRGGTFWGQVHLMVIGEPIANRGNNQCSKRVGLTWDGTQWAGTVTNGTTQMGPVLTRWTGAQTAIGQNGMDDGRFMVGWKVTGPVDGFWHYELAIHNLDNAAGGAGLRLPVCPNARVRDAGFRDIDQNPLNDWQFSRNGGEIAWLATANNPLDWNTIYNVWFDCDAAPVAGNLTIDRARVYPGALAVTVAAEVPGIVGHEYLGDGCGTPAPALSGNGLPAIPNANYALSVRGVANAPTLLALSLAGDNSALGNGCTRFVDPSMTTAAAIVVADGNGVANWSVPIPASLLALDVFAQSAQFVAGGPFQQDASLSNGLRVRIGGSGCQ